MIDSPIRPIAILLHFRHVLAQQVLGITEVILLHDTASRSMPARVYPAFQDAENWIVEPPAVNASDIVELKTFTGHSALLKALEYAHYTYGNALYLSR